MLIWQNSVPTMSQVRCCHHLFLLLAEMLAEMFYLHAWLFHLCPASAKWRQDEDGCRKHRGKQTSSARGCYQGSDVLTHNLLG